MSFTDLFFLFRFLPVFLAIYYLAPARARVWILIAGSYVFYSFSDPLYGILLFLLSVWNYLLGRGAAKGERSALALGVGLDVLALAAAKALGAWKGAAYLPVGMSFYIFRMIFYLADCFRGKGKQQPSFASSLAYFCLFPQLLSGPIMRYGEFEKTAAFRESAPGTTWRTELRNILVRIENGLTYFIFGFAAKVLIADHLSALWGALYGIGYESISTPLAWLGAYAYTLELYYDFWGYSLMAAGLGVMIGLPMIENFLQPYAAASVSDFYRRWHATLGIFFRENVYIPLGGSRRGWQITVRNLAIVWLLTGLWHGVGLNFLLWAGSVLLMILIEKALKDRRSPVLPVLGRLHVWVMLPLTWVVFAIHDTERLGAYFLRLFPLRGAAGGAVWSGDFMKYLSGSSIYLLFALVFLIPNVYHGFVRYRRKPLVTVLLAVLFVAGLVSLVRAGANPFLYLQF